MTKNNLEYLEYITKGVVNGISGTGGVSGTVGISEIYTGLTYISYDDPYLVFAENRKEERSSNTKLPILKDLELIPINKIKIQISSLYGKLGNSNHSHMLYE